MSCQSCGQVIQYCHNFPELRKFCDDNEVAVMKITTVTLAPNNAQLTCYVQEQSPKMPNAAVRPAMLVFPGGAYQYCSDREAEPVALAYLAEGFNAFVLRYTVGMDCPLERALQDAQAALQYVRDHAEDLCIDPGKVAVVGFSAGGHLAAALGTQSPVELRPNAMILGYAVTLGSMWTPMGRQAPDLGDLVDSQTPPAYIFATQGDRIVPVKNSLLFADALADHDIPFELEIFPTGDHGLSLAKPCTCSGDAAMCNTEASRWLPDSVTFLQKLWGHLEVAAPDAELAAQTGRAPLTLKEPFKRLLRSPEAATILQKNLPGVMQMLDSNPLLGSISLRMIASFAPDQFPSALLDSIVAELAAIGR